MSKTTVEKESFLPPLWVLTLFGALLLSWFLYELKELVVLLVVSYAIAYIFDPVLDWLEVKRVPRRAGVVVITLTLLIAIFLLFVSAVPTVMEEVTRLSQNFPSYLTKAKEIVLPLFDKALGYLPKEEVAAIQNGEKSAAELVVPFVSPETVQKVLSGVFAALFSGYSIALTIANLLLLPFIVYYIAIDFDEFHNSVLGLFPRKAQGKVSKFFSEINYYVSSFVRGQLLVCSILFVLYAAGLGFLGVELWILLAVISGFGNLIPYIGFLIGIVLSSLMALVTFGDFSHLIQVWIMFGIVQALEGFVITPTIIGNSVGLSPLIVIIALFAGGQVFGLLGLFLAIPLAAVIRVTAKYIHTWVLEKSKA